MAAVRVEPLSIREKVCFALGEFPSAMMYDVLSLYANIFLLEVVQLTPLAATAVIFGSRVCDVLAYPLLIPALNAFKPNTWGKYKTWMTAATVIIIPSYVLAWYVPAVDNGGKIAWYLIIYSMFLMSQTAYMIAYRPLLMYMTEVPAERDSATTYRIVGRMLSYLLAILVHGQIVAAFGTTDSASCANSTVTNTRSTVPGEDTSRGTLLKDIWEVCTFRPFADLLGVGCLSIFGNAGALVLGVPIAALLLSKFEKQLAMAAFNVLLPPFTGGFAPYSSTSTGRRGSSTGQVLLAQSLPLTMLTDVADDFKIQKGKGRDMLFQTLFQSLYVTAILLASVTSLVALEIGGYQTGACTQPDSVAFTTRLLVSFIPAGVMFLSLVFLWRYQLTGERLRTNKAVLEERRTQQAADSGNSSGTAPQPSPDMTSHDLPDKRGPVQLTYFGPYGSFRFKRP
ncbi:sodium-dependent lysophosphatidylcholine symporter 1-like [Branchiostoma lanceolatum]|uniref:sodium-dependent lysophosphatidylcholine symporter 1-like n=1 Tax=Branchiostoma lanceolatum TaxID=7740 RepID=UPI003455C301